MSRKLNAFGATLVLLALVAANGESHSQNRFPGIARRKRGELDPQTCGEGFDIQRDKIIRTEESLEIGAKYLNEVDLGSREECLRLCCETDSCDVFIYEEKSLGSCYLFSCGPPEDFKCKFTRHSNFSSGVLAVSRHAAELRDRARLSKHEHDLESLRNPMATKVTPRPMSTSTSASTTSATTKHSAPPTQRRCSPYQFECHGSGECIAIYNACDGIPQCADASDEAPELGCPTPAGAPPRNPTPPPPPQQRAVPQVDQLAAQKVYGAEAVSPFLKESSEYAPAPRWPHRLAQAQPLAGRLEDNGLGSHIFNHKGSLLQEGDSQPAQHYVPLESMQEAQWVRRPWQPIPVEQMPMADRQVMYRYGEQPAWKPASGEMQVARVGAAPAQVLPPAQTAQAQGFPDADKMWTVPRTSLMRPESPLYSGIPAKTMPETAIIYSNQESSLRDSPKKGFDLMTQKENQYAHDPAFILTKYNKSGEGNAAKETRAKTDSVPEDVKNKSDGLRTARVEQEETKSAKERVDKKQDVKHEHYKMPDDDHEGLSEKPAGAILLLIMGVLMTTAMALMLGCRLRLARRRMRRAGKSPFAHDADYLVNGMYL